MPAAHLRLISLLVGATFVVILNETIMGVALPHLMDDLDIPATTAQWLTTAFLLTMATVIPVTGYLLQRFHTRQIYIAAMAAFSTGTLIAALAPGFEVLLVGRIVQATGTALMMPLLMTTVMTLVPEERRGQMMGTITIVIAVAPAIGPTISGLVLSGLSWRWMFWIVLPIALLALGVGARLVRNVTEPHKLPIDVVSVVLAAIAFSGVVYGLSLIGEDARGDTPVAPVVPIVVGAVFLVLFGWRQVRLGDHPLMDIRVFRHRTFAFAIGLIGVSMMSLFGVIILLPLFMQNARDASTLTTGLVLLPGGLMMGLFSPFVGRWYDQYGARPLVVPSTIVLGGSLLWMSTIDQSTSTAEIVVCYAVLGVSLALMFTPLMSAGLGALPMNLYAHGSAVFTTLQQVAGAAGTALFITILTRGEVSAADDGLDPAGATAAGFQDAIIVSAGLCVLAFALSLFLRSKPAPAPGMEPAPAMH
ncbi:DHA2 family efflux MFS transporter permease subunit [Conexibacter sp. SYSU D00693]|uniref:DHA2 family efflux MFS transporter permease subunit n=1 Tax=Conexibacter sp. SYSU D00693 TaxID=2812560 RepID=UPI00196B6E9B|nr:DHA2 family efflux MFS transporter permease subunit [Conexibacter sp. SYSU D00693]